MIQFIANFSLFFLSTLKNISFSKFLLYRLFCITGIRLSYHATPKTWTEADKACTREGGSLLIIKSLKEQKILENHKDFQQKKESWLGLKKNGLRWEWVDGSVASWTYWSLIINLFATCATIKPALLSDWKWFGVSCDEKHPFVCDISSSEEHICYPARLILFHPGGSI